MFRPLFARQPVNRSWPISMLRGCASYVTVQWGDTLSGIAAQCGTTGHVTARSGSTSTIRGGTVTMYTQELKGNLFGLIPITFSPQAPPPVNVPFAFFTDVKVTQAGQFGGTLKVPGLRNYFTGGNS